MPLEHLPRQPAHPHPCRCLARLPLHCFMGFARLPLHCIRWFGTQLCRHSTRSALRQWVSKSLPLIAVLPGSALLPVSRLVEFDLYPQCS